jgi:hypothetical protein
MCCLFSPPEYVFAKGIPEEAIVGVLPPDVTKIALPAFKSGSAFIRFLHRVIAKHAPNLPALQEEAQVNMSCYQRHGGPTSDAKS